MKKWRYDSDIFYETFSRAESTRRNEAESKTVLPSARVRYPADSAVSSERSDAWNIYTVRQATQGLANYIIPRNWTGKRRSHRTPISYTFCNLHANTCSKCKRIKTYPSASGAPELSFAVREFGCISGIVIHRKPQPQREYNGYKVYEHAYILHRRTTKAFSQR